jgi:hypothetical protein
VTTGNNTFTLQEGVSTVQITVPIGNYSKISFRIVLQNLLNANSPNLFVYTVKDDNIAIGPDTGKYYYAVSNNGSTQPSFIINSELYAQMGFPQHSTNNFVANALQSMNFVNFNLENTIFLRSDICQNSTGDNVLQEIFTTGIPTASFIKYNCVQYETYAKNFITKSDFFTFYLTDENGNNINVNGININITIMVYEENKIGERIEEYIEMRKMETFLKLKEN